MPFFDCKQKTRLMSATYTLGRLSLIHPITPEKMSETELKRITIRL